MNRYLIPAVACMVVHYMPVQAAVVAQPTPSDDAKVAAKRGVLAGSVFFVIATLFVAGSRMSAADEYGLTLKNGHALVGLTSN